MSAHGPYRRNPMFVYMSAVRGETGSCWRAAKSTRMTRNGLFRQVRWTSRCFLCARDGIKFALNDSALRQCESVVAKSSKLVATKRGRVLLVRRRRDQLWMFPGGRKRARETERDCLRSEIREELPELKLGRLRLWKEVKARNRRSGRKMSDAIFVANKASGRLTIGDKKEIDKAIWRKPRGIRLTPTSRYIRDKLFPKRK
jgi:8-oxo-dGTP diphosphatase